ncbi:MAG TPA: YqgE/AlgH family protein [Rhizomicrobium sp.]|nr:YqgE/AlgH family protein [Rhizomicrobium sp.]
MAAATARGIFHAMTKDNRSTESENFLEGKLLIALPGMSDPRFEKSVIFMCAHSAEGAMGLIVNKPIEGLGFQDVVKNLDIQVKSNAPDSPVLFGGPVDTGRGFVLHSSEYKSGEGTMPVTSEISLTATLDILRAIAEGQGPEHSAFTLGYAGWGPGQIEDEIRLNGWVHCDADSTIIFNTDMDGKWSAALRKLGIDLSLLSANSGRA